MNYILYILFKKAEFSISRMHEQKSSFFKKINKFQYFIGKILLKVSYSSEEYFNGKKLSSRQNKT